MIANVIILNRALQGFYCGMMEFNDEGRGWKDGEQVFFQLRVGSDAQNTGKPKLHCKMIREVLPLPRRRRKLDVQ